VDIPLLHLCRRHTPRATHHISHLATPHWVVPSTQDIFHKSFMFVPVLLSALQNQALSSHRSQSLARKILLAYNIYSLRINVSCAHAILRECALALWWAQNRTVVNMFRCYLRIGSQNQTRQSLHLHEDGRNHIHVVSIFSSRCDLEAKSSKPLKDIQTVH